MVNYYVVNINNWSIIIKINFTPVKFKNNLQVMQSVLLLLFLVEQISNLHFQDPRINSTIKDVLNAACINIPTIYITNPLAPNWIYGNLHPAQYNNIIENIRENNKIIKCPLFRPYSNGLQCLYCNHNQVFNLQTKTCEQCPPGTLYNQIERKCIILDPTGPTPSINPTPPITPVPVPTVEPIISPISTTTPPTINDQFYTDFNNPNIVSNGRPFQQIQQEILANLQHIPPQNRKICPPIAPFFNGSACITCLPDRPYFDLQKKSCVACEGGTVFSPQKHKCVIAEIRYLTSPDAPNLLYGKESPGQYRARFEANKNNFPICPEVTPYFNGLKCIACNPEYPIFNLDTKQCVCCPPTKVFDPAKNKCVSRIDVFPTIQRYLMNIR